MIRDGRQADSAELADWPLAEELAAQSLVLGVVAALLSGALTAGPSFRAVDRTRLEVRAAGAARARGCLRAQAFASTCCRAFSSALKARHGPQSQLAK